MSSDNVACHVDRGKCVRILEINFCERCFVEHRHKDIAGKGSVVGIRYSVCMKNYDIDQFKLTLASTRAAKMLAPYQALLSLTRLLLA